MVLKILRWTASIALVAAGFTLAALAQEPNSGGQTGNDALRIEGHVVRIAHTHLVIHTRDVSDFTVFTRSNTRYLSRDQATRIAKLPIGSSVSVVFVMEGSRRIAETVTLADGQEPMSSAKSRSTGPTSDPPDRTDDPGRPGGFSSLRAGEAASMTFDLWNRQNAARRVAAVRVVEGRVIPRIRPNEVMLRGNDGREFNVVGVPNSRLLLTPDGGVFNDLRPGARVGLVDRRIDARRIAIPQGIPVIR
jgi:hypothetical protein